MISVELAERLRQAGVPWTPSPGDRFVVRDRGMDDEVFVIADMVVEAAAQASGHVLRFNGTTEWALDSLDQDAVLWLPREGQLRELLGDTFVRLERRDGTVEVVLDDGLGEQRVDDADVECAYARAVLAVRGTRA
ncbi:MAG: pilus assembly protein CpaE [Angustibacter sp.]